MVVPKFPPVESADKSGILAIGGDLELETLLLAYKSGIFPWPDPQEDFLLWFAPLQRAILDFEEFKIPRRLKQDLKKHSFQFTIDHCFKEVILACAKSRNRKGQQGTWIIEEMIFAYLELHKAGYAHSFEVWNAQKELVGGLYGVLINKMFAGESMFYKETNASKFSLIHTVEYLKKKGIRWMDIQMLTPLLKNFGAKEILRSEYMKKLKEALSS